MKMEHLAAKFRMPFLLMHLYENNLLKLENNIERHVEM
jgi:hypothetical protein